MNSEIYAETLNMCDRHADRLQWAMNQMSKHIPFTAQSLDTLEDIDIAILDQFSTRFSKLQDLMGVKLFPMVLDLTKEHGDLNSFIDKLNRLEKIGAIPSANAWLQLREMRNSFSHEYPDALDMQAAILNKAFLLARELLAILHSVQKFAEKYREGSTLK
ncbi:MAG: hypothetical protein Q9M10_00705 [Mariprofundaceae bacterium]|nr:hypothetical protein [Mariprofundaceae bacterium]